MKIIHIADLHLDTPFTGIAQIDRNLQNKLIEAPFKAFERLVSIAINQMVDLVLITGDIYDAAKQTISAKHLFYLQLERLSKKNIPVIISHGNHDFLSLEQMNKQYPDNVYVFKDDKVSYFDFQVNEGTVRIYGFSYTKRWIKENMVPQFPNNNHQHDFVIGMLHGGVATQNSQKDNYAPFVLSELIDKNYDYWALGHIHQHQILNENPLVMYPGTIQGKHSSETGDKGGFIIELEQNKPTKYEFISLAPIRWENAQVICQSNWELEEFLLELKTVQNNYLNESKGSQQSYLLTIILENAEMLKEELIDGILSNEIFDLIPSETNGDHFVSIIKIKPRFKHQVESFDYDKELEKSYQVAMGQIENGKLYQESMQELFKHSTINRWLNHVINDKQLKDDMILLSKQVLSDQLGTEIGGDIDEN